MRVFRCLSSPVGRLCQVDHGEQSSVDRIQFGVKSHVADMFSKALGIDRGYLFDQSQGQLPLMCTAGLKDASLAEADVGATSQIDNGRRSD